MTSVMEVNVKLLIGGAVDDAQRELCERDEDYSDDDVALAIRDWLYAHTRDLINNIEWYGLANGAPFGDLCKYLRHRCDMPNCDATALEDDIFCAKHRAEEDAHITESATNDDYLDF